jgi:hypothetical protein
MELADRLATCKQCEKRKFDPNTGIVCSLTLRKPDFVKDCNDFIMDPKEVSKKYAKSYAAEVESKSGSSMSVWGIVAIAFFVIRIIMRFMRD